MVEVRRPLGRRRYLSRAKTGGFAGPSGWPKKSDSSVACRQSARSFNGALRQEEVFTERVGVLATCVVRMVDKRNALVYLVYSGW